MFRLIFAQLLLLLTARAADLVPAGIMQHFVPTPCLGPDGECFTANAEEYSVLFSQHSVTYSASDFQIAVNFEGASSDLRLAPGRRLTTRVSRVTPHGTQINQAAYASLEYQSLYPGVDLSYSFSGPAIKSDFMLQPGTSVDTIRLR